MCPGKNVPEGVPKCVRKTVRKTVTDFVTDFVPDLSRKLETLKKVWFFTLSERLGNSKNWPKTGPKMSFFFRNRNTIFLLIFVARFCYPQKGCKNRPRKKKRASCWISAAHSSGLRMQRTAQPYEGKLLDLRRALARPRVMRNTAHEKYLSLIHI